MTPAQRRKRLGSVRGRGAKPKSKKPLVFAAIILGFIAFILLNTKYWTSKGKLTLVAAAPSGDLAVMSFDPTADEITTIKIPGSTELEVARQLGEWKAKSIWKLGENEKLGGKLVKETVIKNFGFPVVAWAQGEAYGFSTGEPLAILKAMLFPYKTNLRLGDKIRIGLLSFGVKVADRREIDLAQTGYLKKVRLTDGEEGYQISGKIPQDLLIVFANSELADKNLKVNIRDASGNGHTAQEVAGTIEVLGAKVAAVTKLDKSDSDCKIRGTDAAFSRTVSELFECRLEKGSPQGQFDLEIEIGGTFAERF